MPRGRTTVGNNQVLGGETAGIATPARKVRRRRSRTTNRSSAGQGMGTTTGARSVGQLRAAINSLIDNHAFANGMSHAQVWQSLRYKV